MNMSPSRGTAQTNDRATFSLQDQPPKRARLEAHNSQAKEHLTGIGITLAFWTLTLQAHPVPQIGAKRVVGMSVILPTHRTYDTIDPSSPGPGSRACRAISLVASLSIWDS